MNKRTFLKSLAAIGAFFATPAIPAPEIATDYKFARKVPETVTELYDTMNSVLPFVMETNGYTGMMTTSSNWPWPEQEFCEHMVGVNLEQCFERGLEAESVACRWAWQAFVAQLMRMDDPKSAVLYWRAKPTFWTYFDREDGAQKAKIHLRYLISSRGATNG